MATTRCYAFFKPNTFDAVSYAYGEAAMGGDDDTVEIRRVSSGVWKATDTVMASVPRALVELRAVSSDEAHSGIGTYVGCTICVARVRHASVRDWDYGVVVGYTWQDTTATGKLHVTFVEDTEGLVYDETALHVVPIATYALRPCYHQPVVNLMPAEMQALHEQVYKHFTGVGRRATRKASRILANISIATLDESTKIPVYDPRGARLHWLTIEQVLNFKYYHGTNRRIPADIDVGSTLFDEITSSPPRLSDGTNAVRSRARIVETGTDSGRLSDSEDDSDEEEVPPSVQFAQAKRRRVGSSERDNAERLQTLRRTMQDQPSMVRDIDQLIAFRSAGFPEVQDVITAGVTSDGGAQFRPSALQLAIHGGTVNGKYAGLSGQLLVETVQSDFEDYDFLPHPTVCRGFYSWDFGMRGLSTMHFKRLDEETKRLSARKFDLSNFSRSYKMPPPATARTVAELVDALGVLGALVERVYNSTVVSLVHTARRFLMQPTVQADMVVPEAVLALTQWVDERFERFRTCIARGNASAASAVEEEFSVDHVAYTRMVHKLLRLVFGWSTAATPSGRGSSEAWSAGGGSPCAASDSQRPHELSCRCPA